MFVDTCYGQRTVLAGFVFSIVGGQGGQNVGHLDTSWPRGVCSEQKALEPERDL